MTVLDFNAARRARLLAELDGVLARYPDTRTEGPELQHALVCVHACLTSCNVCDTGDIMSKQREADRDSVTSKDAGYVALRLTPREERALAALVANQQKQADELGLVTRIGAATVIRGLLKREAIALGVWPGASLPVELAAEPAPLDADSVRERVESAIEARTFGSAAELAREAGGGVTPSDLTRLKAGKQLGEGKLSAIDAALTARGA